MLLFVSSPAVFENTSIPNSVCPTIPKNDFRDIVLQPGISVPSKLNGIFTVELGGGAEFFNFTHIQEPCVNNMGTGSLCDLLVLRTNSSSRGQRGVFLIQYNPNVTSTTAINITIRFSTKL